MAAAAQLSVPSDPNMTSDASKASILVVDDEASVLLTYRLLLEQRGYRVTAVISGQDAIAELKKNRFDLLLCDLSLEERYTGFDVIEFGRRQVPGISAALLTGYASVEAAERAESAKVAILYKPIDIDQFFSTVSALVGETSDGEAK